VLRLKEEGDKLILLHHHRVTVHLVLGLKAMILMKKRQVGLKRWSNILGIGCHFSIIRRRIMEDLWIKIKDKMMFILRILILLMSL
jgi:hypothetical protein